MNLLFLKIAFRYLIKNKLYSFINIFGLAIGLASFILILLYANYEYSYDKFEGSEHIARPYMDYTEGGEYVPGDAQTYNLTGPTLKKDFPEVLEYVRIFRLEKVSFIYNERIIEEVRGCLSDPSYFDIFNRPLIEGDQASALKDPNTIVLTETLAKKIFGEEDPIGKTIDIFWDSKASLKVVGVIDDSPLNTHIKTNYIISYETIQTWDAMQSQKEPNWNMNNFFTYVKLDPNTNFEALQEKIKNSDIEEDEDERHNIERLEDIHLYSNKPYEVEMNGSARRIQFLLAIAFIILMLSWLNYINLSTTKSMERAKEIGIRKVVGAQRPQLIIQSYLETILLYVLAMVISLLLVGILLPAFKEYTGAALDFTSINSTTWLPLLGALVLGIVLSGIYPALILSNYTPVKALSGKVQTSKNGLFVRKGLIIFQFISTILLLISTLVVLKQIKFMENQDVGVQLDQVMVLNVEVLSEKTDSLKKIEFNSFKKEIRKFPFIDKVSNAQTFPGDGYDNLSSTVGITFPNGTEDEKRIFYTYEAQHEYFELFGLQFAAGKAFENNVNGRSRNVVINETFARFMQISDLNAAIGETMKFWGTDWTIVGIMKDYHHFGLKNKIEPMLIRQTNNSNCLLIKFNPVAIQNGGIQNSMSQIRNAWDDIFPSSVFNYTFVDQKYQEVYTEDKKFASAFTIFTLIAILIASLGLFGLTSYTCIQRRKEIGIRKVNGATIPQILKLLNVDFIKWILIAFVIAVPLAYYTMGKWLEGFAYKTEMSWWIFVVAGLMALVIALLTVSWQSYQAASQNPVEAIKE